MLSEETKQRIARLAAVQGSYRPNAETQARLAEKTLVMLISASCMGKSTIMQELEREIPTVDTITTRPSRPDDTTDRYHFYDHTDAGLAPLLADIEAGRLVQYAVNPWSGYIYGSRVEDYPASVNIGDYFSSVIDDFGQYGFHKIIPISAVTEPASWRARFDRRFPPGHADRAARQAEAITSLEWSLARSDVTWVINLDGASQAAATSVKNIIHGKIDPTEQSDARVLAASCLQLIKEV